MTVISVPVFLSTDTHNEMERETEKAHKQFCLESRVSKISKVKFQ